MKIAFYAPLKSPDHPVPSGDRLMARLIIRALERAGHEVTLASRLRSFAKTPAGHHEVQAAAYTEAAQIAAAWEGQGRPDLWFCYHPYYKAPDFLGPGLCQRFSLPYVTAEASYSGRRNGEGWAKSQDSVLAGIRQAAVNICMTARDREGLLKAAPDARVARLAPFIDVSLQAAIEPRSVKGRLMTVAMMRPGDKMESYRALAAALRLVREPFRLRIAGDGVCGEEVAALFQGLPVNFLGECPPQRIAEELSRASIFLWPGCGEAYGLAYIEAQAAGVPVIAYRTAGVPEVVMDGSTGILTEAGDVPRYAEAVSALLLDPARRLRMAEAARSFVLIERSLDGASATLDALLRSIPGGSP
jgi:glycosyltransferase involved in cell wall biosynthesis